MDPITEAIIISKIRDGIFIGDYKAGSNIDILNQFKISHLLNVSGKPLPYNYRELEIEYLSLNWPENPSDKNNNIMSEKEISDIISFIDDSFLNGEGLFGFSLNGKNRICAVVILYLMKKFKWPFKKCYDYVSTKKKDIDINNFYQKKLRDIEIKIFGKNNIIEDEKLFWNEEGITDANELIMKNTYMNEVQDYQLRKNNFFEEKSRYRIIRHVEWGDNKKFARHMVQPGLVHYNIDKDLFLKTGIDDINIHTKNKPLRSCIKNNLNLSLSLNIASTVKKRKKEKIILEAENNNISIESEIDDLGSQRSNNENNNKNQKKKKNIFEDVLPKKIKEREREKEKEKETYEENEKEKIKEKENYEENEREKIKEKEKDEQREKETEKEVNANADNNLENIPDDNALSIEKIEDIDDLDCEDELQVNKDINIPSKTIDSPINIKPNNKTEEDIDNNISNTINSRKEQNNKKFMVYTDDLSPISLSEENESVKISNKDLKPILKNLLKIDPNLETLKKYIKSSKSKESKDLSCNSVPKSKFNESNNISEKTSPNKFANTLVENNNNILTINSTSNNNDSNNTINLLPLHISSNANSPIDMIKNKSASNRKDNKIFLLNLNLNINKNNTINIKNNIFNTTNNVFKRKDGEKNFFVDSKGNTFYNPFSKFKSRRNNNDKKLNINTHKFFSPNINYYLSKKIPFTNEGLKNEKIPILLNHNTINNNGQKNNNKNERKLFLKKNVDFEKTMNNNIIINKSNSLNHKEGKLIIIIKFYFYL